MGDQERRRCRVRTALVNEMNLHAVDVSFKVIERPKPLLKTRKIVLMGPVGKKLRLITQRYTLTPIFDCFGLRKPRLLEPFNEVFNDFS